MSVASSRETGTPLCNLQEGSWGSNSSVCYMISVRHSKKIENPFELATRVKRPTLPLPRESNSVPSLVVYPPPLLVIIRVIESPYFVSLSPHSIPTHKFVLCYYKNHHHYLSARFDIFLFCIHLQNHKNIKY